VILLADTSILIDLEYVGGISLLPRIAPCEILDVVLAECESERQPDIIRHIEESDIRVVETTRALAVRANGLRGGGVSTNDMMTVCHAMEYGHVVLAGDKPMRKRCAQLSVEYRGSFWIVEELHRLHLCEPTELLRWLAAWPLIGRRFPAEELDKLRQFLLKM
jgi:predicted nucleic acid-binding protein